LANTKTCGNCSLFRPSPYNPEFGNGGCKAIEDWLLKHKERGTKPTQKAIEDSYIAIGGRFGTASALCHPGSDRSRCEKFKTKLKLIQ
jgi:hypothetical protein